VCVKIVKIVDHLQVILTFCVSSLKSSQFVLKPSHDNLLTVDSFLLTFLVLVMSVPHVFDQVLHSFQVHSAILQVPV